MGIYILPNGGLPTAEVAEGTGRRGAVCKRSLTLDATEETSGQKHCNIQQRGKFGF